MLFQVAEISSQVAAESTWPSCDDGQVEGLMEYRMLLMNCEPFPQTPIDLKYRLAGTAHAVDRVSAFQDGDVG
jgi:hypothetical protein